MTKNCGCRSSHLGKHDVTCPALRPRTKLYDSDTRSKVGFPMTRGFHKRQRGPAQPTRTI